MKKEMKSDLEKFRTRWMRWLGNKTRIDKPYWVTLLDSNWSGWPDRTIGKHGDKAKAPPLMESTREAIKEYWEKAIEVADMDDLRKLDSQYADERFNKITER